MPCSYLFYTKKMNIFVPMAQLNILLLEPFHAGSHRAWAEGFAANSRHNVELLTLKGRHWKWRMHGGAVTLAKQFMERDFRPDLILATSMLDLTTFLALTRKRTAHIPVVMYFHENQLTYPWSPRDTDVRLRQDRHYGFINYTSALAADLVLFNSAYHKQSFLEALQGFLKAFPDHRNMDNVERIQLKSKVLYLGMDLSKFDKFYTEKNNDVPVILWNHRWEYDKNPTEFFETLYELSDLRYNFKLIVLGENYAESPPVFAEAKEKLAKHIIHFGYAPDFETYARLLSQADILPITSQQDFFGGSVVEAIYCGAYPLLPKRLAYPEHIPLKHQSQHLYDNRVQLTKRLKEYISNFSEYKSVSPKFHVKKYDWRECITNYDALLYELHQNKMS